MRTPMRIDVGDLARRLGIFGGVGRETAISLVCSYNPDAVLVVGPPFGGTRPQWIVPYGGYMTVDGEAERLYTDYS